MLIWWFSLEILPYLMNHTEMFSIASPCAAMNTSRQCFVPSYLGKIWSSCGTCSYCNLLVLMSLLLWKSSVFFEILGVFTSTLQSPTNGLFLSNQCMLQLWGRLCTLLRKKTCWKRLWCQNSTFYEQNHHQNNGCRGVGHKVNTDPQYLGVIEKSASRFVTMHCLVDYPNRLQSISFCFKVVQMVLDRVYHGK